MPVTGRPPRPRTAVTAPRPIVSPLRTLDDDDASVPPAATPPGAGAERAVLVRVALDVGVRTCVPESPPLDDDPDDPLDVLPVDPLEPLEPELPPEEPDEDDPPLVLGIAWADATAGTASPTATTKVVIARKDLVMACPLMVGLLI